MKVLAIGGSARKNGNTDLLIRRILEKFHAAGMETEAVQFAGKSIEPCKACFACGGKGNCCSFAHKLQKNFALNAKTPKFKRLLFAV